MDKSETTTTQGSHAIANIEAAKMMAKAIRNLITQLEGRDTVDNADMTVEDFDKEFNVVVEKVLKEIEASNEGRVISNGTAPVEGGVIQNEEAEKDASLE